MSRLQDLRLVVETLFRQRLEDVIAVEVVTELSVKRRVTKPKLLVLSRALSGNGSSSLSIVTPEGNGAKVKQVFVVDRLRDVTHDGSFDATLSFGASGMLSVSFESHIQREMFVAAVRREQDGRQLRGVGTGGAAGGGASGGGPGRRVGDDLVNVRGVLSAAVGAEVEADAASRVRRLRQEKRHVFSAEEEEHLLKFMGQSSFDDVKGFQEVLLRRQKEAELTCIDSLVRSAEGWDHAREQIMSLVQEVAELEDRIEEYSSHLLSKKAVMQEIEHSNNTLQQKQTNLESLYVMIVALRDQLSLSPQTMALLTRLQSVPDSQLIAFFSEGNNASVLSEAMKHMQIVLRNPQLDKDYPIAAVAERKTFFLEQRKTIARRSRSYVLSLIDECERAYLADKTRYSHDNRLVWRLHSTLFIKLLGIGDIVNALSRIDPEGFTSVLRRYRTSMQKVYALEICRFIKGLKRQVKVNTWKGPFLLGSSESKEEALAMRMETAQTGETPRVWRGSLPPSPALTPRMMRPCDDDFPSTTDGAGVGGNGSGDGASSQGGGSRMLTVEFPSSTLLGVDAELYADPRTLRCLDVKAASASVVSSIESLLIPKGMGGNGHVRPDLAFAIALESAILSILHEEHILKSCFNIGERGAADAAKSSETAATATDGGGGDGGGGNAVEAVGGRTEEEQEAAALMLESLLELFGGDKLVGLGGNGAGGGSGVDAGTSATHSRQNSRDLGLPPRYPQSPRTAVPPARQLYGSVGTGPRHSPRSNRSDSFDESRSPGVGGGGGGASTVGDGESEAYAGLSREDAQQVRGNFLVREMVGLVQYMFDKCDRIYSVPALCMIRAYRSRSGKKELTSRSAFCQGLLHHLESVVTGAVMRFVAEQTESINRCRRKFLVKPTALLHCFAKMPAFILRLEAVYNALAPDVCDRSEYASIASSLVDQSFDALDYVTNVKTSSDARHGEPLKLNELLAKKVHYALEGITADTSSLKRGFVLQYRHHAFFCAFFAALPADGYAAELLRDHHDSSRSKRDRYEELYLTRVLLVRDFPTFGVFVLSAEDLSLVYSQEELRHHRALAADVVRKLVDKLDKEMRSGVRSSAAHIKKHFLSDVDPRGSEVSFHKTLLQRTWQHFGELLLQKLDFLVRLLRWPMYQGITVPITRLEVTELLAAY